jgi:hypothetical protein
MANAHDKYTHGVTMSAVGGYDAASLVSDTVDLPTVGRAITLSDAGLVKLTTVEDATYTVYIAAGVQHAVFVKRIWSTGTDTAVKAGNITVEY